jgi:hypothetical protein
MTLGKIVSAILVIVVVCIVVGALQVWKPQIDPVETAKASAFNSGMVAKGAELAAIGNCAVCHTAPGGKSYAGSRPLPTPFGTIYSSNITPEYFSMHSRSRIAERALATDGRITVTEARACA